MSFRKVFLVSALLSAFVMNAWAADAPAEAPTQRKWSFSEIRRMPVQSGGRVKPFDSFAREIVLFETGKRSFQGWDPVELLFSWIAYPSEWQNQRIIQITRQDVRRQLGLEENRTFYSPQELFGNFALLQYAQHMQSDPNGAETLSGKSDRGNKGSPRDQELRNVLDRAGVFREIVSGNSWKVVPKPNGTEWLSLAATDKEGESIRAHFVDLLKAYQAGDQSAFDRASTLARAAVEGEIANWDDHGAHAMNLEVLYNQMRPFQLAWAFYVLGILAWLIVPKKGGEKGSRWNWVAGSLTAIAFLLHVSGIAARCYIAGRPPVTNMYESIIWVAFGVMIFSFVLYWIQRQAIALIVASTLATLCLIAADSAPTMMDPGLHPLVPVLRSNFWLTIHVLTITLGYAAFALTLGLANVTLTHFIRRDIAQRRGNAAVLGSFMQKISSMNLLTYRAMQFGVVLLAAGTILGGVWADYSWGRFWGWDPKEVWALIALLCYLAILHGRMTGWIGSFAYAAWTVVGFLSVLMAWYGVNFVLGVGLHSYGFASGGSAWVLGFTALQLVFVAAVAVFHAQAQKAPRAKSNNDTASPAFT